MAGPTVHKYTWLPLVGLSVAATILAFVVLLVRRPPLLGFIAIFGATGMVAFAVLTTGLALALESRQPLVQTLGQAGGALALLAVVAGILLTITVGPGALAVMFVLLGLVGFQMGLPLLVGIAVADLRNAPARYVVLAWPPSLAAGWLLFVLPAPGGLDPFRYNALFLDGPTKAVVLLAIALVTTIGPATLTALAWGRRTRQ